MQSLATFNNVKVRQVLGAKHTLVSLSRLPAKHRTKQMEMEKNVVAAYKAATVQFVQMAVTT